MLFLAVLASIPAHACTLLSAPLSRVSASGLPSATPFQPQAGEVISPFSGPALGQPEPTFTPYPTPFIAPGAVPTSLASIASSEGGGGYLLPLLNNPLTGLPVADASLLDRRPIAIKVTNYPRYVRPQSGLTLADAVFEYYIEDQLTRFIAVMYGHDSTKVGPVRSGRYFDEHVARMYRAYFVFKYADPREYSYFKKSDLLDFLVVPGFGACPPFVVGKGGRDTYNNIFFNTTKFANCLARGKLDNSRQALRSNFFSGQPVGGSATVMRVFTRYSVDDYNYWEYDPDTQRYSRFQEAADTRRGKPESYAALTDAETGQILKADNVVVIFVQHTFVNSFEQEDEIYHIDLIDSGDAFVFRDGTVIAGRWYRTDIDQPLLIATAVGTPIFLRPGVTFYQVIGESSSYVQSGEDWHFQFQAP